MMFGKVCISTNNMGIADYIYNGVNGFIIPTNDEQALVEKMEWIIANSDQLSDLGREARRTYEKYFSMERFGENLETALNKTKCKWNQKRKESV